MQRAERVRFLEVSGLPQTLWSKTVDGRIENEHIAPAPPDKSLTHELIAMGEENTPQPHYRGRHRRQMTRRRTVNVLLSLATLIHTDTALNNSRVIETVRESLTPVVEFVSEAATSAHDVVTFVPNMLRDKPERPPIVVPRT